MKIKEWLGKHFQRKKLLVVMQFLLPAGKNISRISGERNKRKEGREGKGGKKGGTKRGRQAGR